MTRATFLKKEGSSIHCELLLWKQEIEQKTLFLDRRSVTEWYNRITKEMVVICVNLRK